MYWTKINNKTSGRVEGIDLGLENKKNRWAGLIEQPLFKFQHEIK